MDSLLLKPLLAGIGIALVAGPLGSLVIWRRMSYFGDALAHSALLGIALSIAFQVNILIGVIALAICFSLILSVLQKERAYSSDTLLGIMAHSLLAAGVIANSFLPAGVNIERFLFGDILSANWQDVGYIYAGTIIALGIIAYYWRHILFATIHADLAAVHGVKVERIRLICLLLMAMVVALAIKVVGILLISSLLIIPAATARRFSHTPEQMALLAVVLGILSVSGGIVASVYQDIPTGPAIVTAAAGLFVVALMLRRK